MEIGALLCKPKNPYCDKCPITKNCLSFKRKDFEIKKKDKKIIDKFYLATLYKNNNQLLLIKNDKFKFLKNLLIFPMKEISQSDSLLKSNKKLNVKMSNMNMNISIDFSYTPSELKLNRRVPPVLPRKMNPDTFCIFRTLLHVIMRLKIALIVPPKRRKPNFHW